MRGGGFSPPYGGALINSFRCLPVDIYKNDNVNFTTGGGILKGGARFLQLSTFLTQGYPQA